MQLVAAASAAARAIPPEQQVCWHVPVCESSEMLPAKLRRYVAPYRWPVAVVMALRKDREHAGVPVFAHRQRGHRRRRGRQGDTALIVELGLVMLAVTALQVLPAPPASSITDRAPGTGVDVTSVQRCFTGVIAFSDTETARFGRRRC